MNCKPLKVLYQRLTHHSMTPATPPATGDHLPFSDHFSFHPCALLLPPSRAAPFSPVEFSTSSSQQEQEARIETEFLSQEIQPGLGHVSGPSKSGLHKGFCSGPEDGAKCAVLSLDDAGFQNGSESYIGSVYGHYEVQYNHSPDVRPTESFGTMATCRRESDTSMAVRPLLYADNGNQQHKPASLPSTYSQTNKYQSDLRPQPSISEGKQYSDFNPRISPDPNLVELEGNAGLYTHTVSNCGKRAPHKFSKRRVKGDLKCNLINPKSNKCCDISFSRLYDFNRHQQTIHNTNREKVSCEHCAERKTFCRPDALTRHKRVMPFSNLQLISYSQR